MKALFVAMTLILLGCQGGEVVPKTEEDKAFYAVGAMFGQRLNDLSPSDGEFKVVIQGIRDANSGKELKVDLEKHRTKVRELFQERMSKKAEKLKKKGEAYIEDFVKNGGATKTKSGMAYKIMAPGSGKSPRPQDTVRAHYHGTLLDGKVFDSSVERGNPVNFPLNRVIKCWTEGVQKIKKGGKIKLACPSKMAYGDAGAPPKIPGGATLLFDVELLDIIPPAKKAAGKKKRSGKKK